MLSVSLSLSPEELHGEIHQCQQRAIVKEEKEKKEKKEKREREKENSKN
jgi:hypothetical protein